MKKIAISAALAAAALAAAPAQACTQLERSVGLNGAECGVYSLQQIGELRTKIEDAR